MVCFLPVGYAYFIIIMFEARPKIISILLPEALSFCFAHIIVHD